MKEKKKIDLFMIISLVIYVITAILISNYQQSLYGDQPNFLRSLICIFLALYMQIIFHEGGHLVFGLLTGYGFLSFRIGNIVLQKNNDKLQIKKYSMVSTGGQCLLSAPDYNDGNYPYHLYNAGGVLGNVITAIIALVISALTRKIKFISLLFYAVFIFGIAIAVINGIPVKTATISNDAKNIRELRKSADVRRCNWLQLKIYEQALKGNRLKDMPQEWFEVGDTDNTSDIVNYIRCSKANRYIDEGNCEKAEETINELLEKGLVTSGVYYYMLYLNLITFRLLKDSNTDISRLSEKDFKAFISSMKNDPTIIRTQYAIEKLKNKDDKAAEKLALKFENIKKTYPLKTDIITEQYLWDLINEKA